MIPPPILRTISRVCAVALTTKSTQSCGRSDDVLWLRDQDHLAFEISDWYFLLHLPAAPTDVTKNWLEAIADSTQWRRMKSSANFEISQIPKDFEAWGYHPDSVSVESAPSLMACHSSSLRPLAPLLNRFGPPSNILAQDWRSQLERYQERPSPLHFWVSNSGLLLDSVRAFSTTQNALTTDRNSSHLLSEHFSYFFPWPWENDSLTDSTHASTSNAIGHTIVHTTGNIHSNSPHYSVTPVMNSVDDASTLKLLTNPITSTPKPHEAQTTNRLTESPRPEFEIDQDAHAVLSNRPLVQRSQRWKHSNGATPHNYLQRAVQTAISRPWIAAVALLLLIATVAMPLTWLQPDSNLESSSETASIPQPPSGDSQQANTSTVDRLPIASSSNSFPDPLMSGTQQAVRSQTQDAIETHLELDPPSPSAWPQTQHQAQSNSLIPVPDETASYDLQVIDLEQSNMSIETSVEDSFTESSIAEPSITESNITEETSHQVEITGEVMTPDQNTDDVAEAAVNDAANDREEIASSIVKTYRLTEANARFQHLLKDNIQIATAVCDLEWIFSERVQELVSIQPQGPQQLIGQTTHVWTMLHPNSTAQLLIGVQSKPSRKWILQVRVAARLQDGNPLIPVPPLEANRQIASLLEAQTRTELLLQQLDALPNGVRARNGLSKTERRRQLNAQAKEIETAIEAWQAISEMCRAVYEHAELSATYQP